MTYSVFVHVLDQNGTLVGQHDGWPVSGYLPLIGLAPGTLIDDRHHAPLAPAAPQADYRVLIGLYDWISGQRLLLADGSDSFEIHPSGEK